MTNLKKYIAIILLGTTVSACEHKPIYSRFGGDKVSAEHSPEFTQGWNDGCKTGEAVYGNHFTKTFRDFTRDASMVGNPAYESAWYDAYHFCRQSHNTNINNWGSDWWGLLSLN